MSNEADELRYISVKLEAIERHAARISEQRSSADFGTGIVILLLGLILWRVW